MAQAFITTYNNIYRWHEIDRRKSLKPVDKLAEQLPDGDIWLVPKKIGEDDEEGKDSLAAAEASIRKMYRKRLWSIYQVDYCTDMIPKQETEEEQREEIESFDNALLFYCKSLYGPKKKKIPPPLPSAKRVYGYIRPTNMYVPLSEYQNDYGRVAYQILGSNSQAKPQTTKVQLEDIANNSKKEGDQAVTVTKEQLKKSDGSSKHKQNKNYKQEQVPNKKAKKINSATSKFRFCKCFE